VKCSRFFEGIFFGFFSGKFAEIWAKILRTPKNLSAATPMSVTACFAFLLAFADCEINLLIADI